MRTGSVGVDRCGIDDGRAFRHVRYRRFNDVEHGRDIRGKRLFPLFIRYLFDCVEAHLMRGVVDQYVDSSKFIDRSFRDLAAMF